MTPTQASDDEFGALGLFVGMIPAASLLLAGLSLFALKKWAVYVVALNALIAFSVFFVTDPVPLSTSVWFLVNVAVLAYAIWLRRVGVLKVIVRQP